MTPNLKLSRRCPYLPMKNTVLFPYLFLPLSVGRPATVAAVEAALATEEKTLLVVAQRDRRQGSARRGRPVHGRHPGGHQEDGPLRRGRSRCWCRGSSGGHPEDRSRPSRT